MTYTKPEIALLGDAARVIQAGKQIPDVSDGGRLETAGAYDPEE